VEFSKPVFGGRAAALHKVPVATAVGQARGLVDGLLKEGKGYEAIEPLLPRFPLAPRNKKNSVASTEGRQFFQGCLPLKL
jgi:hypothetical protein